MKALLIAAVLVAPLASWAQPLAPADSALIESLIVASRLDASVDASREMMESMAGQLPMLGDMFDAYSPEAGVDSIRAAFARDFREGALRETIAQLQRPEVQPMLDFERTLDGGFGPFQDEIEAVMLNPDAYALADSALIADYVESYGWSERMSVMMRTMMGRMMALFPGAEEEAAANGMALEAYTDSLVATEITPRIAPQFTLVSRYVLKDVDKKVVRMMTEFYSSEGGQYYLDTMWNGSMAASEPMIDAMIEGFAGLFQALESMPSEPATVDVPTCKKGQPDCPASGGPPPPPAPERE